MQTRVLGSRGPRITECGLGCWQIGGGWGHPWDDAVAQSILQAAYDAGVRFFDTADVYGDGNSESERSLGRFVQTHRDITVATKLGRLGIYPDGYTRASVREATERSMERLGVDRINLTQLHCVPTGVLRDGAIFDWLREMQADDLIDGFGASVESIEEGMLCLDQEGLVSLQVIFNILRQRPAEALLPAAAERGVGIIVRLPFASGLLTGKLHTDTRFREGDHRAANRNGEQFNVGETFAGIPYETGVALSQRIATWVPTGWSMAQMALRWLLDHPAVSVVIPGASSPAQAAANAEASARSPLSSSLHEHLAAFYRAEVDQHIRGPY